MSLADRVARAFPPVACVRGYRYFIRRRVDLVTLTEAAIEADVRGKRTQHVRLSVAGGALGAACTCTANLVGPPACRHVWATLLEIDRQGALGSLRASHRVLRLGLLADREPGRRAHREAAAVAAIATAPPSCEESIRAQRAGAAPKRRRRRGKP